MWVLCIDFNGNQIILARKQLKKLPRALYQSSIEWSLLLKDLDFKSPLQKALALPEKEVI